MRCAGWAPFVPPGSSDTDATAVVQSHDKLSFCVHTYTYLEHLTAHKNVSQLGVRSLEVDVPLDVMCLVCYPPVREYYYRDEVIVMPEL